MTKYDYEHIAGCKRQNLDVRCLGCQETEDAAHDEEIKRLAGQVARLRGALLGLLWVEDCPEDLEVERVGLLECGSVGYADACSALLETQP